ncbi:MAG: hypothetical protein AAFV95_17320 [Bacteroidota bacterium]
MKNQLITLDKEGTYRVMAFTSDALVMSSKSFTTLDDLLASRIKESLLVAALDIPLEDIVSITHNELEENLKLVYRNEKGKNKSLSIKPADQNLREVISDSLARACQLEKNAKQEDKTKPLLVSVGYTALTILLSYWGVKTAIDLQNGMEYTVSGRRAGMKQLLMGFIEMVGPIGVAFIGVGIVGVLLYKAYRRYQQPASVFLYSHRTA